MVFYVRVAGKNNVYLVVAKESIQRMCFVGHKNTVGNVLVLQVGMGKYKTMAVVASLF